MGPDLRTLVPPAPVLIPVAMAALLEPLAWVVSLSPTALDPGWYGRPSLLLAVHALTVGAAATAILGAGWQLVPVITARPWRPPAGIVTGVFLCGLPLLAAGLWAPGPVGTAGATLVIVGLLARSVLVIWALARAKGRVVTRAWLLGAELCLWAGLGVAASLWAGRLGHPVFADPVAAVALHVALLLGGWVGGSIVGFGSVLLPMFAVAAEPSAVILGVAGCLWFGGALTGNPWVGAAGALLVALAIGRTLLGGLRAKLAQPLFALAGLAGTAVMLPFAPGDVIVAGALTLFTLPMLRGLGQKIAPYLVWARLSTGAPIPPAPRFAAIQPWLSGAGGVALVVGRLLGSPLAQAGAVLLLAGSLVHIAVLAVLAVRLTLTHMRRGALPGTEAAR